jgi:hypothetical protein
MTGVGYGLIRTWLNADREVPQGSDAAAGSRAGTARRLSWAVVGFALCAAAVPAGAQYPADAATGTLPPVEILANVRAAGYNPVSRPVQHGAVYHLFATDRYLFDVRLTVDARTGRVLGATRLAGASHGGPVYEGALPSAYPFLDRGGRPPVPPALVPEPGRRNAAATVTPRPPPRLHPDDGAGNTAAAAATPARQPAATAAQPPKSPQPAAAPQQPAMVPIAPLE